MTKPPSSKTCEEETPGEAGLSVSRQSVQDRPLGESDIEPGPEDLRKLATQPRAQSGFHGEATIRDDMPE